MTIASLSVSLTARIGKFEKGFKKATRTVKRFGRDLDRATAGLRRMTAVATTAAVGGIAFLTKKQFDAIDATTKTAQKLGLTTEALTGMQFAAEQSGVAIAQMEMGIQRMTRRIAEAGQGTGEAKNAIKELGLNAQNLASLSPDKQFLKIAGAMKNVASQSDRVRLGFKLFDSEGVNLINLMNDGAEGVERYMKEARELGITFNKIDAAKIEQANDAMNRVKQVITGATRTLAIQFAPIVTAVSNKLRDMAVEGGGMGRVVFNAFNNVLRIVGKLADYFQLLKSVWYGFQAVIQSGAAGILKPINALGEKIASVINLIPGMRVEFKLVTQQLEKDFTDAADASFSKMEEAFNSFTSKENSNKAAAFFKDVAARAEKAAKDSNGALDIPGILDNKKDSKKEASFKQIDLSRVVLGGIQGKKSDQKVIAPQLDRTNTLLETISNKVGTGAAVTV